MTLTDLPADSAGSRAHEASAGTPAHEASAMQRIGSLVRDARRHRGLTQQQLADRLGTSQSAIARIEQGGHGTGSGGALDAAFARAASHM